MRCWKKQTNIFINCGYVYLGIKDTENAGKCVEEIERYIKSCLYTDPEKVQNNGDYADMSALKWKNNVFKNENVIE